MLRRLIPALAIALALVGCAATPAPAAIHGSVRTACLYDGLGGGVDGCDVAAPLALSFTQAGFATYATSNAGGNVGSGQTWAAGAHPETWNLPGIDFAEGYSTLTPLVDPVTASASGTGSWGVLPSGCVYQPATVAYKRIYCASITTDIWIEGFNFVSPSLSDCVVLEVAANVTGGHTIHVLNDNFGYGPKAQSNCDYAANDEFVTIDGGSDNLDAEYFEINGAAPSGYTFAQSAMWQAKNTGTQTYRHFVALHAPQRPFSGGTFASAFSMAYFYVDGIVEICTSCTGGGQHGELQEGVAAGGNSYSYFVILLPATQAATLTAPIYCSNGGALSGTGYACTVDHFVIVTNQVAGGARVTSAGIAELAYESYGNVTVTNGWLDDTGVSGSCIANVGGTAGAIAGSLDGSGHLTVTAMSANSVIYPGADANGYQEVLLNGGVAGGTQILSQVSGTAGGTGVYDVSGTQTLTFTGAETSPSPIQGALTVSNVKSLVTGNAIAPFVGVGNTGCQ